ncbi:MAG: tRNA (adenosine(37)-N6)-threonylcarbamoyltransferase complex ATPase subunit type 1 TsaE [bacterium]|nr:tRNA (adenosine(37)-N6)-threonylcarbamoyltransferase complex ATPase subunit type 1 TsaE [bacterium]
MNIGMTWQTVSSSSDATFALGKQFGRNCKGGELFVLSSDLGGGKTTITKGMAKGMGSEDIASSPTFTISKVYKGKDLDMRHFDFYRLNEGGLVAQELAEYINDPKTVLVVEWGDIINEALPDDRITIEFTRFAHDENSREIKVIYPDKFNYILDGVIE